MNFTKNDIEPLDEIISLLLLKPNIDISTLFEEKILIQNSNEFEIDLINTPENTYERYLTILENRNLCAIGQTKEGKYANKTKQTYDFKKSGGFKKLHRELNKKSIDLYKVIPIILTIIFGCSTFYFAKKNFELKLKESNAFELESQNDSLRNANDTLKLKLEKWKNKAESELQSVN